MHLNQKATIETFQQRDEWLRARSTGIGSSDAPVILGLSKWKSPLSLYYEKRGLREPSKGETEYQEWGLALEPAIIQGYERRTGREVGKPGLVLGYHSTVDTRYTIARDPALSFLIASPDAGVYPLDPEAWSKLKAETPELAPPPAVAFDNPGVLEVKNVDISKGKDWEEQQGPPLEYFVQVQHQLMVTGAAWGGIAALVGGNRLLWADVPRDEELIEQMRRLEMEFWNGVINEIPPPVDGSESTKNLLKRLYPKDTGTVVALPVEALDWHFQRAQAIEDLKDAEKRKDEAENKLRAAIGEATVGEIPATGISYSWRWQQRRETLVAATEFRVLRVHDKSPKQ